jgi:hypothetical protein
MSIAKTILSSLFFRGKQIVRSSKLEKVNEMKTKPSQPHT